jgi:pimeloyl-ACP methyl ester carboxylesterase
LLSWLGDSKLLNHYVVLIFYHFYGNIVAVKSKHTMLTNPTSESAMIVTDSTANYPNIDIQTQPNVIVEPRPETTQFAAELEQPEFFTENGIKYGVFRLNRQYETAEMTPVVINLAHGEVAQSGAGRASLNAFAQTMKRPIVAIDMAGMGSSDQVKSKRLSNQTFESLATNHLAIIDKLGIDQFDLVGYSMAGIMSAKIASLAGERVKHLVTFSAPSFEAKTARELIRDTKNKNVADFRIARGAASAAVRQELEASRQDRKKARQEMSHRTKSMAALAILKYASLMREPHMSGVSNKLAASTNWTDVSGSRDPYSDWRMHLSEVRKRNAQYPGSSSFTMLGKETHAWLATRRWEMAALAAQALDH